MIAALQPPAHRYAKAVSDGRSCESCLEFTWFKESKGRVKCSTSDELAFDVALSILWGAKLTMAA